MIIEYTVPSLALNYPCEKYQIIFVYMHEKQNINTPARVNLYEVSTYKYCWR